MAERLESYDGFIGGSHGSYPAEWLDGSVWRLKRGEDFAVRVASLRGALHQRAKREGGGLKTRVPDEDTLIIQFVPR